MRLLPDTRGLPRTFWFLWAGTLVNRLGGFVAPFLAIYLTNVRGLPVERAGLIVSLVGFGSVASGPVGGALADRLGRRRAMAISSALGGSAMLALSVARSPLAIAAAAFALGGCADLYRPAVQAMIADVVPDADRQRAYGLLHWVVNVGFSVSIVVAGLVAGESFGLLFVGDAATTFLFGAIVWRFVPETRPAPAHAEVHAKAGGFLRPYRDRAFMAFVGASLLVGIVFMQGNVTLPVDMRAHGVSPALFGGLMAMNGVMIVLIQPFAGPFVQRFARGHVLAVSALLTGVGFGLFGLAGPGSPVIPLYVLSIAIWTLGEIAMAPVGPAVVAQLAPPALRGSYQGAYQLTWGASSFLAPALGSLVMGRFGSGALWGACVVAGVVAALGFMVVLAPRPSRLPREAVERARAHGRPY
jgi:MFS family permease